MNQSRAAIRYAKAALNLAKEKGAIEAVEKDMREAIKAIAGSGELRELLASPVINGALKKSTLEKLFRGFHPISKGLISLLVDNKRIGMFYDVALKYIILNEELKGKDVAYITTAVPLTAEIEKKVLAQLGKITDKKVTLENRVDKDILGGFVLRVGDTQYDASIATKLERIKREFTKSL